jgi:hypothetical protein
VSLPGRSSDVVYQAGVGIGGVNSNDPNVFTNGGNGLVYLLASTTAT